MKRFSLLLLLTLSACVSSINYYSKLTESVGESYQRSLGEAMFGYRIGYVYEATIGIEPTQKVINEQGSWRVFYSGVEDSKLKLTYREYYSDGANDYIKPAFSEQFVFNFANGDTITFKSVSVLVYSATAKSISYRILKDDFKAR